MNLKAIAQDIEAARVLRDQIAALADGDEDTIRDSLEGEVDFEGMARALLASIGEDEAMAKGLKSYQDELAAREDRLERRAEHKRTLLASALEIAGRQRIETDVGTAALAKVAPCAIVTDESEIPARFFKPQPPKLDKKALLAALKADEPVPGATLSNGSATLKITRR